MLTTFLIPTASMIIFPVISKNMKFTKNNNSNNENVDYSNCNIKIIPKYINSNNLALKGNLQIAFDTMRTLFFIRKHKKIKV